MLIILSSDLQLKTEVSLPNMLFYPSRQMFHTVLHHCSCTTLTVSETNENMKTKENYDK